MATVNFINRKKSQTRAGMRFVLAYAARESKTLFEGMKLVSGVNCSPQSVYQEFVNTKLQYGKDSQRMYYHFVQSFPKNERISPVTAHEIALRLAEHYRGFEVLVCTHTDREHIHSHFIVNSVSFETGKKLHQSSAAIQELRQESDALCMEYGFSICQPKQKGQRRKPMSAGEYHSAERGGSWKMRLMNTVDECMRYAVNKEMFIEMMESEGYAVKWTDSRKNITYTTPEGNRCRDDRLHENKYLKEMMELELRIRQEIIAGGTQKTQPAAASAAGISQPLSPDAGRAGRDTLGAPHTAGTAAGASAAEPMPSGVGEGASQPDGAGQGQPEPRLNSAELATGWEPERAILFSAQTAFAASGAQPGATDTHSNSAGLTGDLVQLGRALERTADTFPVMDATARPQPAGGKKRKLAVGQKQDDHSGYDFEMKM